MTEPLNLSDPATMKMVLEADVNNKPIVSDPEDIAFNDKIKLLQKGGTFTMKFTAEEILRLEREAAQCQLSWREFLEQEIRSNFLNGVVGTPRISRPSFVEGGRVSAPTGAVTRG
jgi:hypothetical protein